VLLEAKERYFVDLLLRLEAEQKGRNEEKHGCGNNDKREDPLFRIAEAVHPDSLAGPSHH
jgi:hypothetical protein